MSNILDSKNFGSKIYERFPLKYREDDVLYGNSLERYIQSLSDGGFKHSIDEMNGILDLIDPIKVDPKILPILFKQYGFDVFNGIPENYLRYLLPNIGEAWSKKGSLSVVEFVTSSLSGIKTSTEVTYDDFNNPTVDVKLEMDYSLGDYFPEAGQFSRLLGNFMPFYCDTRLIYSYLFHEDKVLNIKDSEHKTKIVDNKEDSATLKMDIDVLKSTIHIIVKDSGKLESFEAENMDLMRLSQRPFLDLSTVRLKEIEESKKITTHSNETEEVKVNESIKSDKITRKASDSISLNTAQSDYNNVRLTPLKDDSKLKIVDTSISNNTTYKTCYDKARFRLSNKYYKPDTLSVLGESKLGNMVLGTDYNSRDYFEDDSFEEDSLKDLVKDKFEDGAVFRSPTDSLTNKESCTLNGGFMTNTIYSYDIITIKGTARAVY